MTSVNFCSVVIFGFMVAFVALITNVRKQDLNFVIQTFFLWCFGLAGGFFGMYGLQHHDFLPLIASLIFFIAFASVVLYNRKQSLTLSMKAIAIWVTGLGVGMPAMVVLM